MSKHTAAVITERRQKLWILLTRGLKTYEIARELNTQLELTSEIHKMIKEELKIRERT
jgi:DNA-binding NarL/FixJ family response regulator